MEKRDEEDEGPCPSCNGSTWLHAESDRGYEIQCCDACSSGVIDDDEAKERHDIVCKDCQWVEEGILPEQNTRTYSVLVKVVVNVLMEPIVAATELEALQKADKIRADLSLLQNHPIEGVLEISDGDDVICARVERVEDEEDTYWTLGEDGWEQEGKPKK